MVVFPLIATLIALGCAVAVGRDYLARPKPDRVAWAVAFLMFAAAAGAEVVGALAGWTPLLARVYYVLGATLVVGYLALGELYLLAPARRVWVDRVAGGLVILSALGAALVSRAAVGADVSSRGWEALDVGPGLTALTIGINSVGTLVLLGGLLYSALRFRQRGIMRNRMLGCLLIAAGTLAVASGGTLTRLGSRQFLYIAMAIGSALIFAGYLRAKRPDVARPAPATAPGTSIDEAAPAAAQPAAVAPPAAVALPTSVSTARFVTASFGRVAESGDITLPAELAREIGLRPGDLVAIVPTDDGLLVAGRDTFVTTLLDRISGSLNAQPPADVPEGEGEPSAVLRHPFGRRAGGSGA